MARHPKLSKEIVNERLKGRPVELIGDYKNGQSLTMFKCLKTDCNHEWPSIPNNILKGNGCPKCAGVIKYTKEDINNQIFSRSIGMVGDYESANVTTLFKCLVDGCNHEWNSSPNNILRGKGCRKCKGLIKLTKEDVEKRLIGKNIELVGEYNNTQSLTRFKCLVEGCGYEWTTTANSTLGGAKCRKCLGLLSLTKEDVEKRLVNRQILMVGEYKGRLTKTTFKCLKDDCGREWLTAPSNVIYGCGCPNCKKKNENRIRDFLKETYGLDKGNPIKLRFNNRTYHVDFEVNGTLIEYNGAQHYKPIEFFGGQKPFEKQQKRDQELRDHCKENNIRLIEIPYSLSEEEQYKLIDNLYLEIYDESV